jgi:hypothetical protein
MTKESKNFTITSVEYNFYESKEITCSSVILKKGGIRSANVLCRKCSYYGRLFNFDPLPVLGGLDITCPECKVSEVIR